VSENVGDSGPEYVCSLSAEAGQKQHADKEMLCKRDKQK
jgi:hypothetical protein